MKRQLLTNGRFLTLDAAHPRGTQMLIERGRVAFLDGSAMGPDIERIDMGGKLVVPGFHDAHMHVFWLGEQMVRYVDLGGVRSVEELVETLRDWGKGHEGWVLGKGFDQERLKEKRYPTRAELDAALPGRSVLITRKCGHSGVVSGAGMAAVSERIASGGDRESGLYVETGLWNLMRKIPEMSEGEMAEAALTAMLAAKAKGFTSIGTMLEIPSQFRALMSLWKKGRLPIRVTAHFPGAAAKMFYEAGMTTGFGDDWLRLGAAKFFSDGALGSQTAHLSEPYSDAPGTTGVPIYPASELVRMFREVDALGFQIAVHAIGDQAVRNCLAALTPLTGTNNPLRHRIEHASYCPDDCLASIVKHKILTCIQPQFGTSDTWVTERLGATRVRDCYCFGRMSRAGVELSLSSDAPVETMDPVACMQAAVETSRYSGEPGMTAVDALTAYTVGSAYVVGRDKDLGRFSPGMLADYSVCPPEIEGMLS